jgi:EAL domain-containing protein (putative c-di-GMP-specific phosphodiesterase class I)
MSGQKSPLFQAAPFTTRDVTEKDMTVVFQPIMNLLTGQTFAHEGLARCKLEHFRSPMVLFEQARHEEACGRLGRVVRNVMFEHCAGFPIFVNLHPQELHQRWLVQPTDPVYMHDAQVYLEITEAAAFRNFELCVDVLAEVRSRCDAHLVVDDFGAGHSDMSRVLALRPEFVKLDMSLVRDIDRTPEKQTFVRDVVNRCTELGAAVVAEGIETPAELATVEALNIHYGQGYLLGRPTFPLMPARWPQDGGSTAHAR